MFILKKKIIVIHLITLSIIFPLSLFSAERIAEAYALCISGSPFENCFFLQFFIIETKGDAPPLESSAQIQLNKQTLEPILNQDRYKITTRRFLLKTNRSYRIMSPESNSPVPPSFSFQGNLKERPDSSFELTYKYEENNTGTCRKLEGTLQVEPDKIQIIGSCLREEKKADNLTL